MLLIYILFVGTVDIQQAEKILDQLAEQNIVSYVMYNIYIVSNTSFFHVFSVHF